MRFRCRCRARKCSSGGRGQDTNPCESCSRRTRSWLRGVFREGDLSRPNEKDIRIQLRSERSSEMEKITKTYKFCVWPLIYGFWRVVCLYGRSSGHRSLGSRLWVLHRGPVPHDVLPRHSSSGVWRFCAPVSTTSQSRQPCNSSGAASFQGYINPA